MAYRIAAARCRAIGTVGEYRPGLTGLERLSDWKESESRSNSFQLPHLSHAEVAATSAENALAGHHTGGGSLGHRRIFSRGDISNQTQAVFRGLRSSRYGCAQLAPALPLAGL